MNVAMPLYPGWWECASGHGARNFNPCTVLVGLRDSLLLSVSRCSFKVWDMGWICTRNLKRMSFIGDISPDYMLQMVSCCCDTNKAYLSAKQKGYYCL